MEPVAESLPSSIEVAGSYVQAARSAVDRSTAHGALLLGRPSVMVALDATLVICGFLLGYAARYVWRIGGLHESIAPVHPVTLAVLCGVAMGLTVLELARNGVYRRRFGAGGIDTGLTVFRSATVAMAVVIVMTAALQEYSVSRLAQVYAWLCIIILLWLARAAVAGVMARMYVQGQGVRNVVVVGATSIGKIVMQNVAARQRRGYRVLGFIGEHEATPQRFGRFKRLGTAADLAHVLTDYRVDEVIVALPATAHGRVADIVERCHASGVAVKLAPDLFDLQLSRIYMDDVAGVPLINVRGNTLDALRLSIKRIVDVVIAAAALVLVAPVMAATALAIHLDSAGPIIFRQERLGKSGRPFTIYKFRSMHVDAERQLALLHDANEASGPIFKMRHDPRATRVGRVIRKLSIDELPQLWNVLRGEMSLVGPRPPLAREVAEYDDWHRRRLDVTPGITCLWAVNGRSMLDFEEMVMLDLYYIDNWSLGLEFGILARTALSLLHPSGAY